LDTENILSVISKIKNSKLLDNTKNSYLYVVDLTVEFKSIISTAISVAQFILSMFIITAMIVSMFMLAILLYTSVVEKRLELGILRALGSTNKDIKRYVLSEAFIVGFLSAITGLVLALIIEVVVYFLSANILGLDYNFMIINIPIIRGITYSGNLLLKYLPFSVPLILIIISSLVAFLSGIFPARKAAKLPIVDVLREE
jgi:ABC-type antimicrobial peptide transport system permease subunit